MQNWTHLLSGVRILDVTRATAGPFCTQLLGDLGAEVIKVEEPPGGPITREMIDPSSQIGGMDVFFLCVNRNKKSIVFPLANPKGLSLFYELVKKVDVVCDNYKPGVVEKLHIDYETLKKVNPKIISCSLSGYGATGPLAGRAAFDIAIQAQAAMLYFINKRDSSGNLGYPNVPVADLLGGAYCALGIVSALHYRDRNGQGCRIDVGMYDSVLTWFIGMGVYLLNFGKETHHQEKALWGSFEAKDRSLVITAQRQTPFEKLCKAINRMEWLKDERFKNAAGRNENFVLLRKLINEALQARTASEWMEIFEKEGVGYADTSTLAEALSHPHTAARNMVVTVNSPETGPMKLLGNPIKVDGLEEHFSAPPRYGEHSEQILRDILGYSEARIKALKTDGVLYSP